MPLSDEQDSLSVLALDPFHGGSHRQFTKCLTTTSRHQWHVITGKPVHWKWRMRSAPIDFVHQTRDLVVRVGYPDVLFCTDMLDLPVYLGLLGDSRIQQIPKVVYYHENQWTYPISPNRKIDNHFGYTNLLSAITADEVWFNSQFHLDDFIKGSNNFLKQMPDTRDLHAVHALHTKSRIIPPGFSPPVDLPAVTNSATAECDSQQQPANDKLAPHITVGWVSRWEYDKCPAEFVTFFEFACSRKRQFQYHFIGWATTPSRTRIEGNPRNIHNTNPARWLREESNRILATVGTNGCCSINRQTRVFWHRNLRGNLGRCYPNRPRQT